MYYDINMMFPKSFSGWLITIILVLFYCYCIARLFKKAGYPMWPAFVPLAGSYVLSEITFGNGWWFLITFFPYPAIIYSFVLFYMLGKKFDMNGILMILFGYILIPLVAFSNKYQYKKN